MTSGLLKYFIIFSLLTSFIFFNSCKDNDPKINSPFVIDVGDSKIPYLVIDTKGNEIQFEPKITAALKIYEEKALMAEHTIGIEYRGKTSFRLSDKKGFNIETTDESGSGVDVSLFGFPEEEDWRLVGHIVNLKDKYIFDKTLMYNYVGYELSRSIGRYASRCQFVELEVNQEYLGLYVFMEKLKRDNNRIDIKSLNASSTNLSGGYIITIDKTSIGDAGIGKPLSYFNNNWDDDARYTVQNGFRSNFDIFGNTMSFAPYGPPYHAQQYLETYFLYEYPKAEDITVAQKDFIIDYVNQFETALLTDDFGTGTRTYTNFIELSTFVDYFILNELFRNVDAYRLSTYLQKDRDEKLAMGPIWDIDIGFDNGDRIPINDWVINYNQHVSQDAWMMPFWWPRLLEDSQFRAAVKDRWNSLRSDQLSDVKITTLINGTAEMLKSSGAVKRNYDKWDQGIGVTYDVAIADLKNFMLTRSAWMDGEISLF